MKKKYVEVFVYSLFNLKSRPFGDSAAVLLTELLDEYGYKVKKSNDSSYDRIIDDLFDEIKSSRVWSKNKLNLYDGDIIDNIINHGKEKRIKKSEILDYEWSCNIQQIKTNCFENLWYCLFYDDKVDIFKIHNSKILTDPIIRYSNKQHRGNEGEGQFHVTNKNITHHLDNYHFKTITYDEIIKIIKNKKNDN
jgi:hypothetical protein